MQVNGTVVSVELNIDIEKNGGGTYPGSRLTYRADGKISEQNFHKNALKYNPEVAKTLGQLSSGVSFVMVKEKEGDFWKVVSLKQSNDLVEEPPKKGETSTTASKGGNWETAEERAKKQVYIVRQSSLTNAIALLASNGAKKNTPEEVIKIAKQFEAYVFDTEFDDGSIDTIPNSTEPFED